MVDDNPSNLMALETVLQAPDRNLVKVSSGDEALRYLLDHDVAVILLDVHMPKVDGFETAALIRGRPRSRNVPIIFLTAYDSVGSSYLSRGYSLGAVDYIIKPFDAAALKSKVAVFVELFKKTEEVQRQAELLREKNIELENANLQRLAMMIDLGQRLGSERDPEQLLNVFCEGARDVVGARYAAVGVPGDDPTALRHQLICGLDVCETEAGEKDRLLLALLRTRIEEHCRLREEGARVTREVMNQPPYAPLLGAPFLLPDRGHGWLFLADKPGEAEFSEADERLVATLTAQAAVAYENAWLYAEMRRHAVELEQEVAERKQAEEKVARLLASEQAAREEAEAANRMKDEFLAVVSHELRTPLNAMLGWVHLLRRGGLSAAQSDQAIETIERNARAQHKLVEDLLEVSRIITGKLQLNCQPVEPASLVAAAIASVRPAAEAKGIRLQTVFDPEVGLFLADPHRLQQVAWNLLANSVKFTPEGGRVEVRLQRREAHLELAVSDTGIGIDPDFLPHVFDRFRQADGSSTRAHGGLGLGLAIVRHLIELHGGRVRAESGGPGQGATFTVYLPLTDIADDATGHPAGGWGSLAEMKSLLSGLRVLVVDDDPDARLLLSTILAGCEAEVKTTTGASEGLLALASWSPDVLISDIGMPEIDGYSFIQQVRAISSIPAIALTAYASPTDRLRAFEAGFQAHSPKPIDPIELVRTVARLTHRLGQEVIVPNPFTRFIGD
jgi:signal transduction histidine kinase/DNA-binding response OmpR family regulator